MPTDGRVYDVVFNQEHQRLEFVPTKEYRSKMGAFYIHLDLFEDYINGPKVESGLPELLMAKKLGILKRLNAN